MGYFAYWVCCKNNISFKNGKERMQLSYASLGDAVILEAVGMPPNPNIDKAKIFRCMDMDAVNDNLHVVAMNPSSKKLGLKISKEKGGIYVIEVTKPNGRKRKVKVTSKLNVRD